MIIYRERVLPSAANLALPILLFPSVLAVMLPIEATLALPVATLCTVTFAALIFTASPKVEITETKLSAKGASIDRQFIGALEIIEKTEIFEELGPKLDARAWLAIQASVKGLVKVSINDQKDPTPYWLISTRNPEKLVKLLTKN